ncbi:hypothetical protein FQA39_LY05754 [Lamprigera yunnana]|nr:hypothetical protein FQA39_LY05754 [Lamprigera yunnana]
METKVKQIKEYSLIYNTLPLDKESLDSVEKEVVTLENMLKIVDDYTYEKDALKKEVANVKDIVESLPIDDKTLCEAPESEPKLGTFIPSNSSILSFVTLRFNFLHSFFLNS